MRCSELKSAILQKTFHENQNFGYQKGKKTPLLPPSTKTSSLFPKLRGFLARLSWFIFTTLKDEGTLLTWRFQLKAPPVSRNSWREHPKCFKRSTGKKRPLRRQQGNIENICFPPSVITSLWITTKESNSRAEDFEQQWNHNTRECYLITEP